MSEQEAKPVNVNFNGLGCLAFIILICLGPAACTMADSYAAKTRAEAALLERQCK